MNTIIIVLITILLIIGTVVYLNRSSSESPKITVKPLSVIKTQATTQPPQTVETTQPPQTVETTQPTQPPQPTQPILKPKFVCASGNHKTIQSAIEFCKTCEPQTTDPDETIEPDAFMYKSSSGGGWVNCWSNVNENTARKYGYTMITKESPVIKTAVPTITTAVPTITTAAPTITTAAPTMTMAAPQKTIKPPPGLDVVFACSKNNISDIKSAIQYCNSCNPKPHAFQLLPPPLNTVMCAYANENAAQYYSYTMLPQISV